MRKGLIAATLVLASLAGPAFADAAAEPVQELTPQDDLGCAFWTAAMVGNLKDGEMKHGVSMAMVWFIGRWEGATGRPIEEGMNVANLAAITPKFDQLAKQCPQRMVAFGGRMQAMGEQLQAFGKANHD